MKNWGRGGFLPETNPVKEFEELGVGGRVTGEGVSVDPGTDLLHHCRQLLLRDVQEFFVDLFVQFGMSVAKYKEIDLDQI
jgi:hypothetical protein